MPRLALLATLCLATPAVAGVVSRDLFEPGDGLLTYDPVNGREWLDFSVSAPLHNPSDPANISLPPTLEGFRLATLADVEALMASASVALVDAWAYPIAPPSPYDLISLLSETVRFSGSILGESVFAGGFIAVDQGLDTHDRDLMAVLVAGRTDLLPAALGGPSVSTHTNGYYRLTETEYPFGTGAIDLRFDNGPDFVDLQPTRTCSGRLADDLCDSGGLGVIRVYGPDGTVIAQIPGVGGVQQINVFWDRVAGVPAYWLYRDAAPIPEPTTVSFALAGCLAASRLRGLA